MIKILVLNNDDTYEYLTSNISKRCCLLNCPHNRKQKKGTKKSSYHDGSPHKDATKNAKNKLKSYVNKPLY